MLKTIVTRIRQGERAIAFPDQPAILPELFRGYPLLTPEKCPAGCRACAAACPYGSITFDPELSLDMGTCLFCTECSQACPAGAISFSPDPCLATNRRDNLFIHHDKQHRLATSLDAAMLRLFGRSLKLRQVSAGGCNACEADTNVLNTVVFDLGRFGIQFVASPRHADGILVTGPVTHAMKEALLLTWEAVPAPKIVIASGACAIGGGPFRGSAVAHDGVDSILPVDLYIPGCPPHPITILDGLLRLLGKLEGQARP